MCKSTENAGEGSTYWIFTQNPNVQAFTGLMNRALDKPSEHIELVGDGSPLVIRWQRADSETLEGDSNVMEIPASDVKQIESHDDET